VELREGTNDRHRHPQGHQEESLPCHPDTLRDAVRRVTAAAWAQAHGALPFPHERGGAGQGQELGDFLTRRHAAAPFPIAAADVTRTCVIR